MISECAAAAYATVDKSAFALDNVQSQFLSKTDPPTPIDYTVQHISTGRRFAVRFVLGSQNGRNVICATICFASLKATDGQKAMRYTVGRGTPYKIEAITLDDLEPKTPLGPFMKFQRFPIYEPSRGSNSMLDSAATTTKIATSACQISSDLSNHPSGHMSHFLGILNLSDYHVLDTPPAVSKISVGLFAIDDKTRTPRQSEFALFTSLNHSIWFHRHDGFRADEMCHVEARTSWANGDGRAYVDTRIFGGDDQLIATCAQEVSFVLDFCTDVLLAHHLPQGNHVQVIESRC